MNCHSAQGVKCSRFNVKHTWAVELEHELSSALPSCRVAVRNAATPGTRIDALVSAVTRRRVLGTAPDDIVIEDYSINDNKGLSKLPSDAIAKTSLRCQAGGLPAPSPCAHGLPWPSLPPSSSAFSRMRCHRPVDILTPCYPYHPTTLDSCSSLGAGMESFVRHVQSHGGQPIVFEASTFPFLTCNASNAYRLAAARHHAVPYLSFPRATCGASGADLHSLHEHWKAGCGTLDAPGVACAAHPGPATHRWFARLLAAYVLSHAAAAAAQEATASSATAASTIVGSGSARDGGGGACGGGLLLPPLPKEVPLPAKPSLLNPDALAALQGCAAPLWFMDVSASCDESASGAAAPVRSAGWSCYEDRPGKPGWLSSVHGSSLSFRVRLSDAGYVSLSFLRSYEGMARARVALDGDEKAAQTLDGLWESRTSQPDRAILKVSSLQPWAVGRGPAATRAREATLSLQVTHLGGEGAVAQGEGKFKLLTIETC